MAAKVTKTLKEDLKVNFVHLRMHDDGDIQNQGGATIAYVREGKHVAYAVAKCRISDNFNRKLGRLIASNRLNRGAVEYLEVDKEATNRQVVSALCSEYYDDVEQHYPDCHMYIYPKFHHPEAL